MPLRHPLDSALRKRLAVNYCEPLRRHAKLLVEDGWIGSNSTAVEDMRRAAEHIERLHGLIDAAVTEGIGDWCCGDCYDAWLTDPSPPDPAMQALHQFINGT